MKKHKWNEARAEFGQYILNKPCIVCAVSPCHTSVCVAALKMYVAPFS